MRSLLSPFEDEREYVFTIYSFLILAISTPTDRFVVPTFTGRPLDAFRWNVSTEFKMPVDECGNKIPAVGRPRAVACQAMEFFRPSKIPPSLPESFKRKVRTPTALNLLIISTPHWHSGPFLTKLAFHVECSCALQAVDRGLCPRSEY